MKSALPLCLVIAFCASSSVLAQTNYSWGFPGARAVPGDYDGDGHADLAVYHESSGAWYIYSPGRDSILAWNLGWGFAGGEAAAMDYDGDGCADLAIFSRDSGNWFVCSIAQDLVLAWNENWGAAGMQQAAADYDGDGSDEIAVYEESSGAWFIAGAPQPVEITDIEQLAIMYSNAVADAATVSAEKIYKGLTAITLSNTNLVWRTNPGTDRLEVKAVSFMSYAAASNYYHEGATTSLRYATSWVTMAPELRNFCRAYTGTNLALRLKQLVGLPATAANDTVVEFWVDPAHLARPSPDPQVSDSVAELDFTTGAFFSSVSTNYVDWFNNNIAAADYGMTNGVWGGALPWTRLGYTYDWALPSYKTVGLSEFIIPGRMLWDTEGVEITVEVTLVVNALYYAEQ